jgi:hypothetical protein
MNLAEWERVSGAALRTFFRIGSLWSLTQREQMALLGLPARCTFLQWRRDRKARLDRAQLERVSHVFGIFKALQILLPDPKAADAWVKRPNAAPLFQGRPALEHLLRGGLPGLRRVRRYLEGQTDGWVSPEPGAGPR